MLGLPGNPVSAMVCGEVFLRPAVEAAQGLPAGARRMRSGRLARDLPRNGPREHYMRAVIEGEEESVTVFDNQDSSLLATLARANALVVRPPHAAELKAGAKVSYIAL